MAFNDIFKKFEEYVGDKNIESDEEFDKLFNEFMKQEKTAPFDITAECDDEADEDEAYRYLDMAADAATKAQALKYAKKALEVAPDNVDAQITVLELSSDTAETLVKKYRQLIETAESRLKADGWFSDDYVGEFWGVYETRPYMRIRANYIDALINCSMLKMAMDECREMLRLCENDNIGTRYRLMHLFAHFEDEESALELLEKYNEKSTMFLLPLSILYFKKGKFTKSAKYLRELNKCNKDAFRFFELSVGDELADLSQFSNEIGYRPFTIEELVFAVNENPYLFISVPKYFEWAYKKLKVLNKHK